MWYCSCGMGFLTSRLAYSGFAVEFLSPRTVSLLPERLIKANTHTKIALTKSTNSSFHLSSCILYNCCSIVSSCSCQVAADCSSAFTWLLVRGENRTSPVGLGCVHCIMRVFAFSVFYGFSGWDEEYNGRISFSLGSVTATEDSLCLYYSPTGLWRLTGVAVICNWSSLVL